jgi:signal transduction histidine kinase
MLIFALLVLTAIVSFILCATVLKAGSENRLNRYIAVFTYFISWWAIGDLVMLYGDNLKVVYIGAVLFYVAPMITTLFVVLFADSSPQGKPVNKQLTYILSSIAIILGGLITVDPLFIIDKVHLHPDGRNVIVPHNTPLSIYTLYFSTYFLITYVKLFRRYRNNSGLYKSQLLLLVLGVTISSALALLTNLTLPLYGIYDKVWMGPIFTLFFATTTVIAIIRHRYLDIRSFTARATAYVSVLVTLGAIYAIALSITTQLVLAQHLTSQQQFFTITIALLLAATFTPLKHFFDKVTNRLFYQDAYEPQHFLDELNKELVSNIELTTLLDKCNQVMVSHLKSTFSLFTLKETGTSHIRIIGTASPIFKKEHIKLVRTITPTIHQKVIVTADLDETHKDLARILHHYDIAVLCRLSSDITHNVEGLGYILLGPKKSGNTYNEQDLRILEIITNELVIAIQNALQFEEIQRFNVTLQNKIEQATEQLKKSNKRLRALDETKDDFISMASHQLRTPLTSMKGYVSMVLEGDAGKVTPEQQKMLEQAFLSSQRMTYLISDLLNVSRLKTGKFIIEPSTVNVADLVEQEMVQLKEVAQSRGVALQYEKPKSFPFIQLDETKTRQVIMNFIDNAIYYTPPGGHITVDVTEKPESIELTVTDNGIGVPRHEQHHLFTKFYRAPNAQRARPDGTGLGLFMAKKVIIAQGGSIIFKSVEGKGSLALAFRSTRW